VIKKSFRKLTRILFMLCRVQFASFYKLENWKMEQTKIAPPAPSGPARPFVAALLAAADAPVPIIGIFAGESVGSVHMAFAEYLMCVGLAADMQGPDRHVIERRGADSLAVVERNGLLDHAWEAVRYLRALSAVAAERAGPKH
jgi:hypothetical protein